MLRRGRLRVSPAMKGAAVAMALSALAAQAPPAEGGVVRSSDWTAEVAEVHRIALAPINCSAVSIDCAPGDAQVLQALKKAWPGEVIPFYKVRQVMFDLSIDRVTADTAPKIAEALGADALLVPEALAYDKETVTPGILGTVHRAKAHLVLFAKSGKKLVEGTENYEGTFFGDAGHGIVKPLQVLVQQAFRFLPSGSRK